MILDETDRIDAENAEAPNESLNELETIPMEIVDSRLDDINYVRSLLEAILLVATEPVEVERVAKTLGIKKALINEAAKQLAEYYKERGIIVKKVANGYEFGSNPVIAEHLELFYQFEKRRRVSRAALQTLSIIAYNQPLTRAEIEAFRGGINSEGVIQSLIDRDLVKIAGKKDCPGNPYLYSVSDEFLRYFGLNDINELKEKLPSISEEITRDDGVVQLKLHDLGIKADTQKQHKETSESTVNNGGSSEQPASINVDDEITKGDAIEEK